MKFEIKKSIKNSAKDTITFAYRHIVVKLILFLDPWLMGTVSTVPYHCYFLGIIHWWIN